MVANIVGVSGILDARLSACFVLSSEEESLMGFSANCRGWALPGVFFRFGWSRTHECPLGLGQMSPPDAGEVGLQCAGRRG